MLSSYFALDLLAGGLAVWLVWRAISSKSAQRHYPPGPKGLPLIGNVLDVPKSQEWETYSRWNNLWGDVVSMNLLGQRVVILGSVQAAFDLLDKQSLNYSDRPYLPVACGIVGHVRTVPMVSYGEKMRKLRRMITKAVGTRALVDEFMPLMAVNTQNFIHGLLEDPQDFKNHIKLMTAANILLMSHGHQVKDANDRFIQLTDLAIEDFSAATTPGNFLADVFPILTKIPAWFPGAGWKTKALRYRYNLDTAATEPFEFVKNEMAKGTALPGYVSRNLEENDGSPDHEDSVKWSALTFYTAGSDTTASSLYAFFLAMTRYPEVQRRAQQELDAVVGGDRIPTFQDRDRLPYVNALCSEITRWMPVGPLGLPHASREDDVYKGYFIPKGTIIYVNNWKLLHDPETYHDPLEFKPERFLATDGKEPEYNPNKIAFGYGRRVCPGMQVAEATIFICVATTLALFDIAPTMKNGKPVIPPFRQTSGIITQPEPFTCEIKPRSEKAAALIQHTVEHR